MNTHNITQIWAEILQNPQFKFFIIPSTLITVATLIANPVLLVCIFLSRALRQETRYLLLANTLAADMLFLVFNMATVLGNTLGAAVPMVLCELNAVVTVTAYSCAVLTVTLMVADTYAAVRWPLRYHEVLPPARTHLTLAGVWVVAGLYPFSHWIVVGSQRGQHLDTTAICMVLTSLGFMQLSSTVGIQIFFSIVVVICTVLIFYCYIRLYMVTKTQGIWQSRYSRARVTLLAHGAMLLLYFAPAMVFIIELFLFQKQAITHEVRVWVSTVNMSVFVLLPRALAPYLYGLRYREISDTVLQLLHRHKRLRSGPRSSLRTGTHSASHPRSDGNSCGQ